MSTDEDENKAGLDDSSDDDCPNFSVYSAETMALAKNISEPNETGGQEQDKNESRVDEEREEDLVQLDDDEDDDSLAGASESAERSNKKCELELHDDSDSEEFLIIFHSYWKLYIFSLYFPFRLGRVEQRKRVGCR